MISVMALIYCFNLISSLLLAGGLETPSLDKPDGEGNAFKHQILECTLVWHTPNLSNLFPDIDQVLDEAESLAQQAADEANGLVDDVANQNFADIRDDINQGIDEMDNNYNDLRAAVNDAVDQITDLDVSNLPEDLNNVIDTAGQNIGDIVDSVKDEIDNAPAMDMSQVAETINEVLNDVQETSLADVSGKLSAMSVNECPNLLCAVK